MGKGYHTNSKQNLGANNSRVTGGSCSTSKMDQKAKCDEEEDRSGHDDQLETADLEYD